MLQRLIVVANLLQSCNGIATEIAMVSNETIADLLQICNGIAIELQQYILQRLIVVANLLQSCNGMVVMVSNETVADLLQICNGMATTLAYSLSFDFWDLATDLATDVKFVTI